MSWQRFMLLMVFCLSSCGDSPSLNNAKPHPLVKSVSAALTKSVKKHDLEMGLAGEIFAQQAMRKAKLIEEALLPFATQVRSKLAIDALEPIFVAESMALADLDPKVVRKYVVTEKLCASATQSPALSVLLRGKDSSKRLILLTGAMPRRREPGVGATAMEIAGALEVMRVLIQRRAVGRTEPLPFDLEYIHMGKSTADLGFLSQIVPRQTLIVGVLCLEDLTPENVGSSNLVIQIVPRKESTLVSALGGTMKQYAGNRPAWNSASISATLLPVSSRVLEKVGQDFLPYCVIRCASSELDRAIQAPRFVKGWLFARKQIDKVHRQVGGSEDLLKNVCDRSAKSVVAPARCIAMGIMRVSGAFSSD